MAPSHTETKRARTTFIACLKEASRCLNWDAGQLTGADTVASLFNGVAFSIRMQNADGSEVYGTINATPQIDGRGNINLSLRMTDELRGELYEAYLNDGAVNFEITATSIDGHYALDEKIRARLLNNGAFRYVP